ncbi:hypothetical protein ACG33_10010 [Steroidobacter denitrificans]|uniref:Uncharacterized protein n=1 Tax=Steroidobacter denitrificans TaxID=465721 RepID=A0A127FAH4_STEDE|nr:DUF6746 family protein [Steroidobacter denitrificans]AMN47424.1 hypothetical protein ACG33_10010 [Steroidobacter denitrificans]
MKNLSLLFAGALLALSLTGAAQAERPDHFRGKPAATLSEAVSNFSEYNQKLAALVAQNDLTPADMVKVHELTYTLENALKKINAELAGLAEALEEVHLASERLDAETLKTQGQKYLQTAGEIIR